MTLLFKFLRQFWLGWCPDFSVISLQKKTKVQVVKLLQLIEPPAETETPENRQLGVQQIWRVYNTRLPPKRCGSQSSCRHRFAPKRETAGGNIFLPIPRSRRKYRRRRRHDRVRRFFFWRVCCFVLPYFCFRLHELDSLQNQAWFPAYMECLLDPDWPILSDSNLHLRALAAPT